MDTTIQPTAPVTSTRRPVPTTQLLHFTVILNVVCGVAAVLIYLIIGISGLARDGGSEIVAGGLVVALICGLSTWWWVHCWNTLKNLRAYAEELFWNNK